MEISGSGLSAETIKRYRELKREQNIGRKEIDPSVQYEVFLSKEPHEEYIKREGVYFTEVKAFRFEYDADTRRPRLILECYGEVNWSDSINTEPVLMSRYGHRIPKKFYPSYKIVVDTENGSTQIYREGEPMPEVESFKVSYDGGIPVITLQIIGDIKITSSKYDFSPWD